MSSLADLKPDPANARAHNPRNIGMIADALQQVGAARSIVVDEDNVILAGNGVAEAAAQAGIERVQFVDADGETLIVVRRKGLTPEQKKKLALYDNRTGELATWDAAALAAELEAGLDLGKLFYEEEIAEILEQAADALGAPPTLDQLGEEYGEPQERDFWPVIRVQVSPDTKAKYDALMKTLPGKDEAAKFEALVSGAVLS